jgi:hypothetical protein
MVPPEKTEESAQSGDWQSAKFYVDVGMAVQLPPQQSPPAHFFNRLLANPGHSCYSGEGELRCTEKAES